MSGMSSSEEKGKGNEDEIEIKEQKGFEFAENIANQMSNFTLTPNKDNETSPGEIKE